MLNLQVRINLGKLLSQFLNYVLDLLWLTLLLQTANSTTEPRLGSVVMEIDGKLCLGGELYNGDFSLLWGYFKSIDDFSVKR
jgi:hypothetical protein